MSLAILLRNRWEQVSSRCAVTLEELDRAEVLSDKLTLAVGYCDRVPELLKLAGEQRQRAYTLFIRAYTEVRDAVVYLRRNHGGRRQACTIPLRQTKTRRKITQNGNRRGKTSPANGFT